MGSTGGSFAAEVLRLGYTYNMAGRVWAKVRPAVFWDYRRGSWQYDIIVALILAFIFLMPKGLFNDRPSEPVFHRVEDTAGGTSVYWIDPGALDRANPEGAEPRLQELLRSQTGEELSVVRMDPARDQAGNIRAYLVYAERN